MRVEMEVVMSNPKNAAGVFDGRNVNSSAPGSAWAVPGACPPPQKAAKPLPKDVVIPMSSPPAEKPVSQQGSAERPPRGDGR